MTDDKDLTLKEFSRKYLNLPLKISEPHLEALESLKEQSKRRLRRMLAESDKNFTEQAQKHGWIELKPDDDD